MKIKLTYPAPGYEYKVGLILDVTPAEAKRLIDKEWCIEVDDEKPKPKPKQARKEEEVT